MVFTADESVDKSIIRILKENNYKVYDIAEIMGGAADNEVMSFADTKDSILVTADKDFGELVFLQKKVHKGIVLIRLHGIAKEKKASIILNAVKRYGDKFENNFTVVQRHVIRIRFPF
ncbi:MAG: DUF5615 family PIN-like protein [Bacteroidales bacterium]|nr:DUF5615 family PIN-like protein [Bacteroidales bacterium]